MWSEPNETAALNANWKLPHIQNEALIVWISPFLLNKPVGYFFLTWERIANLELAQKSDCV